MTHVLTGIPQWEVRKIISTLEKRVPIQSTVWDEMVPMTWEMISEMHRHGFTIGSHTKSHTLLPYESSETIASELKESRRALELHLKTRIAHFAYPDGRFNPAVIKAVHKAGYKYAYTICRSRDIQSPLLTIPRKVLWERSCINALGRFSPAIMKCQSQWVFDSGGSCEHDHSTIRQSCGVRSGVFR
jgi:peptidoglycan/xylan/chitin deacetylase (PgdA/CDA1 family)